MLGIVIGIVIGVTITVAVWLAVRQFESVEKSLMERQINYWFEWGQYKKKVETLLAELAKEGFDLTSEAYQDWHFSWSYLESLGWRKDPRVLDRLGLIHSEALEPYQNLIVLGREYDGQPKWELKNQWSVKITCEDGELRLLETVPGLKSGQKIVKNWKRGRHSLVKFTYSIINPLGEVVEQGSNLTPVPA